MSDGEVCIVNIGPKQRQIRLRFGLIAAAVTAAAGAGLMASGVSHLWRLLLVLPAMTAGIGVFQYTEKT